MDKDKKKGVVVLNEAKNYQYDMFSTFFPSNKRKSIDYSNAIAGWDLADKYTASKAKIKESNLVVQELVKVRNNNHLTDVEIETTIKPAIIVVKSITYFFYPSDNEELLEQILRKLFIQNKKNAYHTDDYSLLCLTKGQLEREFKLLGKTRSYAQINLYLEILNSCHVEIRFNGVLKHSGPIISTNIEVDKDDDKFYIQLPLFLTASINSSSFSQYYFPSNKMCLLARYMVKRFTFLWTNANYTQDENGRLYRYIFYYSDLLATGLLPERIDKAKIAIIKAFKDLEKNGFIIPYDNSNTKFFYNGNKMIEIEYKLTATYSYVKDLKASSARKNKLNLHP